MSDKGAEPTLEQHLERLDPNERHDHQAAQHWARYEWAARFLPAETVLDCACGVGYGSFLLHQRGARQVIGLDISEEAITTARRKYAAGGIDYRQADALELSPETLPRFDRIVSLETIEHVAEPQRLLDHFQSLLEPEGILLLSCPNDLGRGAENPYHLWRADYQTVKQWLDQRFTHVNCYGEVHTTGAIVWPLGEMVSGEPAERMGEMKTRLVDHLPLEAAAGYLFACSQHPLPQVGPTAGQVLPSEHDYLRELEQVRDRLWQDLQQMARAWEAQTARVGELDELKDRLWNELQENVTEKQRLTDELAAHREELAASREELTQQRQTLNELLDRRVIRWLKKLGLLS